MNVLRKVVILLISLCSVWTLYGQKNITKPNIQTPNNVSVNTYTGGLFHQRQDLMIPGRGLSIDLTFTYNTVSRERDWGFGRGWTFNYNMAYSFDSLDIVIEHMDGSRNRYLPNGSGGWYCPAGVFDSLEQYQPNQFLLTRKDGMKYFFDNEIYKKLTKIQDRNDNTILLTYTDSLLTTITDPSGRQVNLTWTDGRLTKITDPNTSPTREIVYSYDVQGNPISVLDPLSNITNYAYDNQYKLTSIVNKNGNPVDIVYNTLDAVREVISCVGKQTLTYNYENFKTYLVEDVGGQKQITTYEFNEAGQIVRQSGNCCGFNVQFEYDESNNITKRIDANGNATSFVYDGMGNVLQELDPLGNAMVWTYESQFNQMASETDRNGNATIYSYDSNGNLLQISKPLGIANVFSYDAFGNLISFIDGRGNTTTYTYDNFGNRVSTLDPESGLTLMSFDGVGNNISFTDPNNNTTTLEFDLLNRLTKVTNPLNTFVAYTYDAEGNRSTVTDRNGNTTTYVYDALNRLLSKSDALGQAYTFEYNESGNLTRMLDPVGNEDRFFYNQLNRLERKINPLGDATRFEYDGVGNLTTAFLPSGNTVVLQYDLLNRVQSMSDDLGLMYQYSYDNNSNNTSITNGNGSSVAKQYDALNRLVKFDDPAGESLTFQYDQNDNLIQKIDQKGNAAEFTYDDLNRQLTSKDPLNNISSFAYDPNSNLLSFTDPNNHVTLYTYDDFNRRITETYADGNQRGYTYDSVGNLTARSEPNGYTVNFVYDGANRLTSRQYPGNDIESFVYDANGRVTSAANANATVLLSYDGNSRLQSESINGIETTYQYDVSARTKQINYPSGKRVVETFDPRGRIASIFDEAFPNDNLVAYQYDTGNRLTQRSFNNNTSSSFLYDVNDNVTQLTHSLNNPVAFDYDYDIGYNRKYEKNSYSPAKSKEYLYDDFSRLIELKTGVLSGNNVPNPDLEIVYNYDNRNNRTATTINGIPTNYTSNNLNQYTSVSGGLNLNPSYDNNGNLTGDGNHTYEYDNENRLETVDGGSTAAYLYDALGRRISKIIGTDTTFYFYAEIKVIEERSNGGVLEATYVNGVGLNEVLTMNRNGSTYYYYTNSIGSITHVANTNGDLVEFYDYDAYGKVSFFDATGTPVLTSLIGNPYLFTGQRFDEETDLYFYHSRYYSPTLGRFLQRDPLGYVDGPSLYEYTFSNPVNWVDPLGLSSNPCDRPWWESPLDWLQTGLDLTGLIPGVGEIADGINAGIYAARGDWVNAGLSAAAMVPFAGWGATAAKTARKVDNAVDAARGVDNAVDAARGIDNIPPGASRGGPGGGSPGNGGPPSGGGRGGGDNFGNNGPHPSTPVGRRGSPMDVPRGTNAPTNIGGRDYSGHAIDQMQGRGVPPSAVDNAINNGTRAPGHNVGTSTYTDSVNGVQAVVNDATGNVITVKTVGRNN